MGKGSRVARDLADVRGQEMLEVLVPLRLHNRHRVLRAGNRVNLCNACQRDRETRRWTTSIKGIAETMSRSRLDRF